MPLWGTILGKAGELLKPISDIVDNVTTNKEEKAIVEAKLKEIVFNHEAEIERIWNEREQQYLSDVQSARAMNIKALESSDKFIRRFPYWLSGFILVFVFAIMILIISGTFDSAMSAIVYTVIGYISAYAGQVINFFFGSTRGSDSKNETIRNMSK